MQIEKGRIHAPEISSEWLNSPPLTLRELRGRVVLIDFWDYTCVNCIRTLPYLVEWDRRYRDLGLTIIGAHAPEFQFARTVDFVREAVARFQIRYPVVLDNHYRIWQAFANKYWPAKYLIDKDGYVRYFQFGEGDYSATELTIQELLREIQPALSLPAPLLPFREADRPGAVCYRVTPELYLGYDRGKIGNPSGFRNGSLAHYELPETRCPDVFFVAGFWTSQAEFMETAGTPQNPSRLLLAYTAKEVNLVMVPHNVEPIGVEARQDGHPVLPEDAGEDLVRIDGRTWVEVTVPRMYRLINNQRFDVSAGGAAARELELSCGAAGLGCYAFTFVSCALDSAAPGASGRASERMNG